MKLGFIGYGKMSNAIIKGILDHKLYNKEDIYVNTKTLSKPLNDGFKVLDTAYELIDTCDIIILGIKPQVFKDVFDFERFKQFKNKIIISVAAGVTFGYLKKIFPNCSLARIMPNLASSIGQSVSTIAFDKISDEDKDIVCKIASQIGSYEIVTEDLINVLIPLNGSFPAYFWQFIKGFCTYAKAYGIDETTSRKMLALVSIGCANLLNESDTDLDTLINNVCSKKGTTIEGVECFNDHNLNDIINKACNACLKRANEIDEENNEIN